MIQPLIFYHDDVVVVNLKISTIDVYLSISIEQLLPIFIG